MRIVISISASFIIILASFAVPTGFAAAHVLKVDGSMGVVLHVDPDDDPVVGQQTNFYFDIKDKQNQFSPEQCICTVEISRAGGEVAHKAQLFTASAGTGLSVPALSYTFLSKGVYRVTLSGQPKTNDAFQKFRLFWDVRVERGEAVSGGSQAPTSSKTGHNGIFLLAGMAVIIGMVTLVLRRRRRLHGKTLPCVVVLLLTGALLAGAGQAVAIHEASHAHDHPHIGSLADTSHSHIGNAYCAPLGIPVITTPAVPYIPVALQQVGVTFAPLSAAPAVVFAYYSPRAPPDVV